MKALCDAAQDSENYKYTLTERPELMEAVQNWYRSMFVWAPIPEKYSSSADFCFTLLEKTGVLCTPGSAFGALGEGYVRFALTKTPEEIAEIVKIVWESSVF